VKLSLIVLFALLTLSGCTQLCPEAKFSVNPDQLAFEEAYATFQQGRQVANLENFIAVYPDSPWADRARTLVLYARDLEQLNDQLTQQQTTLTKQQSALKEQERVLAERDSALAEQNARLKTMSQENQELTETINSLKGSLIELEQRPQ